MNGSGANPFEMNLEPNPANYVPLQPTTFLPRTAEVYPDRIAVIHGDKRITYRELQNRSRQLADVLRQRGIGKGDVVALMAANTPEGLECHFGVPMVGAVLNPLNTRLDAKIIAFILDHGEAKILITDTEFSPVIKEALTLVKNKPLVIDIDDPVFAAMGGADAGGGESLGEMDYEAFIAPGDPEYDWPGVEDEWQAIMLSYTSGTTGDPKGVVSHARGAFLNAMGNGAVWAMPKHPVYLWTLPMFHAAGWCFPWTITLMAGTHVCLRRVEAGAIFKSIADNRVTHMCGAPIVLSTLINASNEERTAFDHTVNVFTAGAAPPPAVLRGAEAMGFDVTHVYGLTEVFGPSAVNAWHEEWDDLEPDEKARIKARQGVGYPTLDYGLMVADGETLEPVVRDGVAMGEIFMRGNTVMSGYLKNPAATEAAFAGGWFHTGDLAVWHPDGYVEIKDRSKDIIISGGENISSVEVEAAIYDHPDVIEAAVVALPHEKWGETPRAYVGLREGSETSEQDIIGWCRDRLAHFKCPTSVVFMELPKTSTGKIQKFKLREIATAN